MGYGDVMTHTLRLGTRGSTLARMQSQLVADALEKGHPGLGVELRVITTTGDRIVDQPLHEAGGKGLFTKELELALLAGEIDFAVHSYKDVPVTMPLVDPSGLLIAATPERADPRDVLISREGAKRLSDLPSGAKVGTGSLRRISQILQARPDLRVVPIRGNIDTRLRKLADGQYDAVVLALAGLLRTSLFDAAWMTPMPTEELLPAPGQGALALQCRRDDGSTRMVLRLLHHPTTELCVAAERELVQMLGGDCHSPIGVLANLSGETIRMRAAIGARDGRPPIISAGAVGPATNPSSVVAQLYHALCERGVQSHLRGDPGQHP